MTTAAEAPSQLVALALAFSATGEFAAATLSGEAVADEQRLRELTRGKAIVTDSPAQAEAVIAQCRVLPQPDVWNVIELAALVLPHCPTFSLDHVGAFLGVEPPDDNTLAGRAKLIGDVFNRLLLEIDAAGLPTLHTLNRLARGLEWSLSTLFRQLEGARPLTALESESLATATPIGAWVAQGARRRAKPLEPDEEPPSIDLHDIEARFGEDGALAGAVPGYETRAEQVRMAQLVATTLNTGGQLLVEAGTGTGKGLAYLLPAALQAAASNRRVVVSTATTNLQDQLFEHDLPLVQAALGAGTSLRACVLKGRGNYLCLNRWQLLLHAPDWSFDERTLLIKTLFWLPRTRTGDRAELRLTPGEDEAWQRINAVTEACTPTRCTYHRIGACFLARARRAAEESHVVITNHALLLTDLATRSRVLPEYHVLILDEAHHLEDEATAQLGWRLGERELVNRLASLWTPGHGASGLVPQALAFILVTTGMRMPSELAVEVAAGENAVLQLNMQLRALFEGLQRVMREAETKDDSTLRINAAVRAGSTWQDIEAVWLDAQQHTQAVERLIGVLLDHLREVPPALDKAKELISELSGQIEYWRDQRRRLGKALQMPVPEALYWISTSGRLKAPILNVAPLEVASILRERLFAEPHASILVSATLAIDGSFEYVKRRLGLYEADSEALGSSYDYAQAALLYVPNDLPDPTQPGYQLAVERTILDVVTRLRGRTLVLFTSRAHLRATYQAVREPLLRQGITVLAQGVDEGSRTRLLESFRRGARVVLLGTNAFWEGVDVVGDALSSVIVARLPFSVPTDPIYAARAEQFDEPFMEYAVPQAVLRLKQGFGRLIRSRSDRGAVVVLDRRLVTRYYGQMFLRSLPPCHVKQGPIRRTGPEVDEWLTPRPLQLAL